MSTIKNILFPTDFTKDAEKAFRYALEISRKTGAKLHLLHSIEEPYDFAVRVEEIVESQKRGAQQKLERMMEEARESDLYKDLAIYAEIKRGKAINAIFSTAEKLSADLIVMGTKGASSLKRILYGNVTSSVILDSQVPVLTVPTNSKKPYMDRFIFATDFRERDIEALRKTVNFASPFEAEIHVLHVSESVGNGTKSKLENFKALIKKNINYENIHFEYIEAQRFSQGVSEYLDDTPISLVVITRYKKAFLKTVLWASNTQELTYHTSVPMLVQIP